MNWESCDIWYWYIFVSSNNTKNKENPHLKQTAMPAIPQLLFKNAWNPQCFFLFLFPGIKIKTMLSVNHMQSKNTESCCSEVKEKPKKMRHHDEMQYLDLIQYILDNGIKKEDRTGKIKHEPGRICFSLGLSRDSDSDDDFFPYIISRDRYNLYVWHPNEIQLTQ